jgi:hypothetical protein
MKDSYFTWRRAALLLIATALVVAPGASAASVNPSIADGSPSCKDIDSSWTSMKVEGNAFGDYSDGTLSVRLTKPGPEETFDWTSNIGVSAVIVGDGARSNVYRYDPASTSDTRLATPSGSKPSNLQFCYVAQFVLGERVASGSAKLTSVQGCARREFSARVTGRSISRVVFLVDGNRVAVRHRPGSAGDYGIRINPARYRAGAHRVTAQVEFKPWTHTRSRTLSSSFKRC